MQPSNPFKSSSASLKGAQEEGWKKSEKISSDLCVLTYAAIVAQIVRDSKGNAQLANGQLERLGKNIGKRLIEEYLCKSAIACDSERNFGKTLSHLAKAFKVFCGIEASVVPQTQTNEHCIEIDQNPFEDWVDMPQEDFPGCASNGPLNYSQMICGMIVGALEMIQMNVECHQRSARLFCIKFVKWAPHELMIDAENDS